MRSQSIYFFAGINCNLYLSFLNIIIFHYGDAYLIYFSEIIYIDGIF